MSRIVECVPNFSEGRRPEVLDQILAAIQSVSGVSLIGHEMDASHHRSVVTFVGDLEPCGEAAFRATKMAQELIDLNHHQGEHQRMGATDVVPFIPISGVTMDECIALARKVAKRINDELAIPTYLYENAALRADRTDLAVIRKGQFEGLREAVKTDPARAPDFGRCELHPTAGATVVGARAPLVAFNIDLNTPDVEIAKKIAASLRFRGGGFMFSKAMGFFVAERNCAQVSINMTDYTKTGLHRAFEFVKIEAARYGVMVRNSEIVGLVPQQALIDTAVWHLQLDLFKPDQILESKLVQVGKSLADFLGEMAAPTPTPGGGSAAALSGAIGSGLLAMVAGLTVGKKGYEAVSDEMAEQKRALDPFVGRFHAYIEKDAQAFDRVMDAFKLPKNTDTEKAARSAQIQAATRGACEVPLAVMALAVEGLERAVVLAEKGNKNSITDVAVGALHLQTALKGAHLNVLINLPSLKDAGYVAEKRDQAARMLKRGNERAAATEEWVGRGMV